MIERVVKYGEKVNKVCQDYHISRVNFYKWLRRYRETPEDEKLEVMEDRKPRVERYAKQTPELYEQAVLDLVAQYPQFGVKRIVGILPEIAGEPIVGYHGVQKILERNSLNTYEQRLAYSQAQITPVTRLISVFEGLGTRFIVLPVETRVKIIRFASFAFATAFATTVILGFFGYMATVAVGVSPAARIGLGFATVALFVGSLFFAYSMKYYLTLAIVLSFSRQPLEEGGGYALGLNGRMNGNHKNGNGSSTGSGWLQRIFGLGNGNSNGNGNGNGGRRTIQAGGLQPSLDHVKLKRYPFVSIHLPFYNEKKVVERILDACTSIDYPNFEIIVCDDSNDETVQIVQRYVKEHNQAHPDGPIVKVLHRPTREGFKGGALSYAVEKMDPRTEFCVVFDADFIPYPDTLEMFVKYFKVNNNGSEEYRRNNIAVVGGYQWHVLNKSENWVTRGVRTEYAGSYVIERPGREILGLLKQVSGSVYMIRADVLKKVGWGTSITEDFQLTLKLYAAGYKVIYTPYVQAPAECVSTLKRLIRQRMRWSEGHSNCIKHMFVKLMLSPKLTLLEKLEVLYISPYYLQAFFFLLGTFSWLIAETVFRARLPFWTSLWGWSLVLTNFFALPLMNAVGLFLEEAEEKDYLGILSFIALSYIMVPFQAYASVKGFLEEKEGPWFRTPKTGRITDIFTRGKFYRWVAGILPGKRGAPAYAESRANGRLAWLNNPHVALATANNQFSNFKINRSKARHWGKMLVSLVVIVSLSLNFLATRVPIGLAPGGWMRVTTQPSEETIASQEKVLNLAAEKTDFRSDEQPTFWLKVEPEKKEENKISLVGEARAAEQIKTEVFYGGKKVDIPVKINKDDDGNFTLAFPPQREFKPGKYILKASFSESGVEYQGTQDFTWGVLAINTDKSIYLPDEEAFISMAVLDNQGKMICDAQVNLEITDPNGQKTTLTTENGEIKISEECDHYGVTDLSDYYTSYKVGKTGDYQMRLTAKTENGTHFITDQFRAQESVDFEVKREGPTRIYPNDVYKMKFILKANKAYQGPIREYVPSSFEIIPQGGLTVTEEGKTKVLSWNKKLIQGEAYGFGYEFDAPDESPMFYLLGPLKIGTFQEARQWQIASDPPDYTPQACNTDGWAGQPSNCKYYASPYCQGAGTAPYASDCTVDDCAGTSTRSSTSGIQEISIDGTVFTTEDTATVTVTFGCYSGGGFAIAYDSGSGWVQLYEDNTTCATASPVVLPIAIDDVIGTHYVRALVSSTWTVGWTCANGNYSDNDDMSFEVISANSAPNAPTLSKLFDNERTADNTPAFQFSTTDDDTDDVRYEIQWDTANTFDSGNLVTKDSSNYPTDAGWTAATFSSSATVTYTVQAGDAIANGTWWWRVRARDPAGSDTWGSYSSLRSFTINTAMDPTYSEWFQTTDEQFATDDLNQTQTTGEDSVNLIGW